MADEILKVTVHTETQKVVFAEGRKRVMHFLSKSPSLSSDDVHKDKKLKLSTFEDDDYVDEPMAYCLITDELVVKPWSFMAGMAVLEELNVKLFTELEVMEIPFGPTERKRLMEMSLEGKIGVKNVLTTLFLTK